MPLIRRLPKRGFNNAAFHKTYAVVNLSDLSDFKSGATVSEESLRGANLIRGNYFGIKILGDGELKHELKFQVHKVSASAREKIEKAGGSISEPAAKQGSSEKTEPEPSTEPVKQKPKAKKAKTTKTRTPRATKKAAAKKATPKKTAKSLNKAKKPAKKKKSSRK